MIRFLVIFLLWVGSLGVFDIDIRFQDGLHIRLKSWLMWLMGKYNKLPRPDNKERD